MHQRNKEIALQKESIAEKHSKIGLVEAELKKLQNQAHDIAKTVEYLKKEHSLISTDTMPKHIAILIDIAVKQMNNDNYQGAKRAYDSIREIYPKLNAEGKKKTHHQIISLRDAIVKRFYK